MRADAVLKPADAPTLPAPVAMFTGPTHPDAHHRVTAPGGYEWWYFDAESDDRRTHVVAILFDGYVFHPGYLRADARYRTRPTRAKPAFAGDYPCAYLVVYRDGKVHRQFLTQVRPSDFEASADEPRVRVGDCSLAPDGEELRLAMTGTPWFLTARGPRLDEAATLACDLRFAPRGGYDVVERTFLSREMTGEHHGWIPAAPRCRVEGTVDGERFVGHGYHDHNYGTGPLGSGLRRWVWGRAFAGDGVVSFHVAEPRDASLPVERHLYRVDDAGFHDLDASAGAVDWSCRSKTLLPYPVAVDFGDEVRLSSPRVVDDSPFYLRVAYDAVVQGQLTKAFCEVGHPHRLRFPILGRMIEMSIDKRRLND